MENDIYQQILLEQRKLFDDKLQNYEDDKGKEIEPLQQMAS